jgi:hypothetical protein
MLSSLDVDETVNPVHNHKTEINIFQGRSFAFLAREVHLEIRPDGVVWIMEEEPWLVARDRMFETVFFVPT